MPTQAPASLRVYALSKAMRHPLVDPMESYELFRELECYAAAENDETARRNRQQAKEMQAARRRRR